jgi:hypothetical protein
MTIKQPGQLGVIPKRVGILTFFYFRPFSAKINGGFVTIIPTRIDRNKQDAAYIATSHDFVIGYCIARLLEPGQLAQVGAALLHRTDRLQQPQSIFAQFRVISMNQHTVAFARAKESRDRWQHRHEGD